MTHLVSLAAGAVLDALPPATVDVAARAGYRAVGLWFDADQWTPETATGTRSRLASEGIVPLDIEVVRIAAGPLSDTNRRLLAAGGDVGARNVLCIGTDPDHGALTDRFAEVCDLAAEAGMRAVLEFMRFTTVRTLGEALAIVEAVQHPAAGILVDALHLDRCGHRPDDLVDVSHRFLPYAQLCDAVADGPGDDVPALVREALDLRLCPGEGGLPLTRLLDVLGPDIPLSIELRSEALRTGYPDPVARARVIRERTEAFLAGR